MAHRRRLAGGLAIAIALTATLLGDALTTNSTFTNNPESVQADALLSERLGETGTTNEIVIVRSSSLTVDDPAYRGYVEELYGDLTALGDGVVAGGTHYYLTGDEMPGLRGPADDPPAAGDAGRGYGGGGSGPGGRGRGRRGRLLPDTRNR